MNTNHRAPKGSEQGDPPQEVTVKRPKSDLSVTFRCFFGRIPLSRAPLGDGKQKQADSGNALLLLLLIMIITMIRIIR